MIKKLCFFVGIASLLFSQLTAIAEEGDLHRLADNKGYIKVFVDNPVNRSGQGFIAESLKKALESAFANRRSVKFELVKTPGESDVQITAVIKKFMYMEKGPLKPTPGIGTTLLDAAATMTENYAEILVDVAVIQFGTGEILWKDTLNPYLKQKMEPEESIPLISDRVATNFVAKCFGKSK